MINVVAITTPGRNLICKSLIQHKYKSNSFIYQSPGALMSTFGTKMLIMLNVERKNKLNII
jgi:hypothetical protein